MQLVLETMAVILRVIWISFMTLLRWVLPTRYKSIEGEVCLITGGGSGIGRLMALELAKRGAVIVLWDVNEKGNNETAEMITKAGGKAFADKCDVSNSEEVYKAAQRARDIAAGDITMLINNAGIFFGKEFLQLTDAELEKTMKVNSLAHMWTTRAFLPSMLQNNHGHIVTIASVLGLLACPGMADYVASKHAAVGLHNGLELEIRKHKKNGVKTTLVCPYHINTGMFSGVSVRFPSLLPTLEPEECVAAVVHAVLTDQAMVAVPRMMYVLHNITTWFPHEALLVLNDFLGTFESMNGFLPTRKYQKEAAQRSS